MNTHTCYFLLFFKINMLYANNKQQIHSFIFIITLILSLIFSWDYKDISAKENDKVETWTWLQSFTWNTTLSWAKRDWGKNNLKYKEAPVQIWELKIQEVPNCSKDCKIDKLIEVGIDKKLAQPLVENCKRMATSPVHCIIAWASVITAESGWKLKNCYHKNCTWLWAWWLWYDTYEAWIIDWIIRYNKYWYKAKSASFFYPSVGEKSRSRYCTSEHSSWSAVGCPNGQKSAQATWNKLSKLF